MFQMENNKTKFESKSRTALFEKGKKAEVFGNSQIEAIVECSRLGSANSQF